MDFVVVSRSGLERGQPGDFERRFPNKMGYFAVSQPGLNSSNTEAILYIDHGCVRVASLRGLITSIPER